MEAVKRYVSSDVLANIVSLPKSFIGKNWKLLLSRLRSILKNALM